MITLLLVQSIVLLVVIVLVIFFLVNDHLLNVVAGGFNNNSAVTPLLPHQRDRRCRYCMCDGVVIVVNATNNCIVDDCCVGHLFFDFW